jgi:hypothetical protein
LVVDDDAGDADRRLYRLLLNRLLRVKRGRHLPYITFPISSSSRVVDRDEEEREVT